MFLHFRHRLLGNCCRRTPVLPDGSLNFADKNGRAQTPDLVELSALQAGNAPLGVRRAGSPAQADTRNGQYVSGNFFRTLGVQPWIGRLMTDSDDHEGAPPVAVMSYRIWHEK